MYPLEEDFKVISMRQPFAVELTTLKSKQFHSSMRCCISKTFILCTIHRDKIHEQPIFPRAFIFVLNSRIVSVYLTKWGNCSKVDML